MMRSSLHGPSSASPTMGHYLDEIRGDALLTAEDERELAAAIAEGDEAARSRMIRANLRLVVRIARDYLGRGLPMDDLIGEGNLGLIRATEDFDPRFGVRFSTYAAYWIKQSIRHALINTTAPIRLPAHMVVLLTKWNRVERALRRERGYDPSPDQIADVLGLSAAQRDMVARALRSKRIRGEADRSRSEESSWSADEMVDDREAPEAQIEESEARAAVRRRLALLDDREREVITLRYGLGGEAPQTLKEIGRRLGITREWVRRVEVRALQKLDDRRGTPSRIYRARTA